MMLSPPPTRSGENQARRPTAAPTTAARSSTGMFPRRSATARPAEDRAVVGDAERDRRSTPNAR